MSVSVPGRHSGPRKRELDEKIDICLSVKHEVIASDQLASLSLA